MLQQDYLMRLIMQFVRGLRRSLEREKENPAEAAESLEDAIAQALDLDAGVVLGLHPESFASVLSVSGTDPHVVEYLVQGLMLEARYLDAVPSSHLADLRRRQAHALAATFGLPEPSQDCVPTAEKLDAMLSEADSSCIR